LGENPEVSKSNPLLEMDAVTKRFGATRALDGVSIRVEAGEVHALIGENGAGKSTLMKVLSGVHRPDSGTMSLEGRAYSPRNPRAARLAGVTMIYQELALAPHLSVEANVMLGQEQVRGGLIRRSEHRRLVRGVLELLEHPEIRPEAAVRNLSIGAQQLVEVARALVSDARVIVFDEPTSSLSEHDATRLFTVIERLAKKGLAIVYISHFLEELRQVARSYTVLRDGRSVGDGVLAKTRMETIIGQMVGRALTDLFPRVPHQPGEPILELAAVSHRTSSKPACLQLRRGEVLGIAGLIGAGRTELLRSLFGLDPIVSGEVRIGQFRGAHAPPRRRIEQGVGFLSEDRKAEGLALGRSIEDNMTYSALKRHTRRGWLRLGQRRAEVARWIRELRIRAGSPNQQISELSGGNQQKVALARLLHQEADVFLLDEPTRGIDVGSKSEIYRLIGELAAQGKAVLVVSSYLPELFGICDRIAVMTRGALSEARPTGEWSEHRVMELATGA
jgi:ribose transport system ATP-binding protein